MSVWCSGRGGFFARGEVTGLNHGNRGVSRRFHAKKCMTCDMWVVAGGVPPLIFFLLFVSSQFPKSTMLVDTCYHINAF
jgi:hypothetical protein